MKRPLRKLSPANDLAPLMMFMTTLVKLGIIDENDYAESIGILIQRNM